jgi:hypothetical protein
VSAVQSTAMRWSRRMVRTGIMPLTIMSTTYSIEYAVLVI